MGDAAQAGAAAGGAYGVNAGNTYGTTGVGAAASSPNLTPATTGGNYLGTGATVAGGLLSAYASLQAGDANKKISRANARADRNQAQQAIQAGQFAGNRAAERGFLAAGAQRAAAASSGVVVGSGTQRNLAYSNDAATEMDRTMIELNARRQAYGYETRAVADTFAGDLAQQSGRTQAAETLLNTGSRAWMQADRSHERGIRFGNED